MNGSSLEVGKHINIPICSMYGRFAMTEPVLGSMYVNIHYMEHLVYVYIYIYMYTYIQMFNGILNGMYQLFFVSFQHLFWVSLLRLCMFSFTAFQDLWKKKQWSKSFKSIYQFFWGHQGTFFSISMNCQIGILNSVWSGIAGPDNQHRTT